jgi:tetratricopeptide (TPR) repeat protein
MNLTGKNHFLFCLFLCLVLGSSAQQSKIDSLKQAALHCPNDTTKVFALNKYARALANSGELDSAFVYFEQSLEFSKTINYHFGIAAALNNIGKIYMNKSSFPEAQEYFFKSLEEAERYNVKQGQAAALGNLGIIYENQKDYNKALRYHFKSLKIEEQLGNLSGVADSYNSIGNIYYFKKNYNKVIEYYNKSLDIKNKLGDLKGSGATLANIGNTYYFQNAYAKAREYYLRALEFFEKVGDPQSIALISNNIAETYVGEKNFKEALKYSSKSLEISKHIGSLDDMKSAYMSLSGIYEGLGDYKLSLLNHKLYSRFNDSIYNDENTRKEIETDLKYHFDKKTMNTRIENERKQILMEEKAKEQRLIIYFGAGILVLVIAFAIYAFRSFKLKQRTNLQLSLQKEEISRQRNIVEAKNKGLTDSIHYAKRIQQSLMPQEKYIQKIMEKIKK